jgi:protein-disulfide isomerase
MKARLRRLAVPAFFAVVVIGILAAVWRILLIDGQYRHVRAAPQGQSTGPAEAGVTIVEFMDYRCKPCRQTHAVMAEVASAHPDVRIVFRHRPIPYNNEQSIKEARIALAAGMQGRFMPMHDLLMDHDDPVDDKELDGLCEKAGVDCSRLRADMMDPAITDTLNHTLNATSVLHINRVPTFLIGNDIYTTSYGMPTAADFDRLIARAKDAEPARPAPAAGSKD